MSGASKSQVSRLCGEIDDKVNGFLDRPLEGDWPYLWLDATYVKVRQTGRIVSVAVTVAVLSRGVSRLCFLLFQSSQGRVAGFGKGLASLILGMREVSPAGTSWPFSVVAEGLGTMGAPERLEP